jgi:hypothetical protein
VWKAALGSDGAGRRWQDWLAGLPPLRTRTCRRLVVVTPHRRRRGAERDGRLVRARKLRAVPPPVRGKGEIDDREFFLTTAPGAAGG